MTVSTMQRSEGFTNPTEAFLQMFLSLRHLKCSVLLHFFIVDFDVLSEYGKMVKGSMGEQTN